MTPQSSTKYLTTLCVRNRTYQIYFVQVLHVAHPWTQSEQDEAALVDPVKLHVAAAVDPVELVDMNARHSLDHPLVIHHVFGRLLTPVQ